MLGLVVHPHVICDVCSGQQLPTDVAGDLLLVANHVRPQTILRGKTGLTGLTFFWKKESDYRDIFKPKT